VQTLRRAASAHSLAAAEGVIAALQEARPLFVGRKKRSLAPQLRNSPSVFVDVRRSPTTATPDEQAPGRGWLKSGRCGCEPIGAANSDSSQLDTHLIQGDPSSVDVTPYREQETHVFLWRAIAQ